ncbi:MAG: hypothetical protein S4CHLAM123_09860 [Chlamydiales bacterium]|nr:hypothetical protein [Chlamydiales bacterium]
MNKKGEPLYDGALPLFEKVLSHLIWVFFWLVLILVSHLFLPQSWMHFADKILMSFVFVHCFIGGCRLTTLLLHGGLAPILFPPLWVRLTRRLLKGEGMELLSKHNLERHPGLLSNLALMHYHRNESTQAMDVIKKALMYAPDHPILQELQEILMTRDSVLVDQ